MALATVEASLFPSTLAFLEEVFFSHSSIIMHPLHSKMSDSVLQNLMFIILRENVELDCKKSETKQLFPLDHDRL